MLKVIAARKRRFTLSFSRLSWSARIDNWRIVRTM
jgi:hypothetical protein